MIARRFKLRGAERGLLRGRNKLNKTNKQKRKGHIESLVFAEQINKIETKSPPKRRKTKAAHSGNEQERQQQRQPEL